MKYIVYLTLNLVNNKKYIGVHKTEDPNVFDNYYGCGIYRHIPSSYKKSKTELQYAINKYGIDKFKRITLAVFDNEEDAYTLESHLVTEDFIRRPDVYNMTTGGSHTDRSIKCYQYTLLGDYIREYKSYKEAAEFNNCSRSVINKAVLYKTTACNSLWTNFYLDKLDISQFTIQDKNRIIYEYDSYGNYIAQYDSINDLIDLYGVSRSVLNRAIQGRYKVNNKYYSTTKVPKFIEHNSTSIKNRSIYLYTLVVE